MVKEEQTERRKLKGEEKCGIVKMATVMAKWIETDGTREGRE